MAFGHRPAEDGEILREDKHEAPVDRAAAGHHPVAGNAGVGHAEIDAVMFDIGVDFLERPLVQQDFQPFARGQLALGVLGVDAFLPAAHVGCVAAFFHFGDIGGHAAGPPLSLAQA